MNWPHIFHLAAEMAAYTVTGIVCLCLAWFSLATLRDKQKAREYARRKAMEPAKLPAAVIIHLSMGDRLGDLQWSKKQIEAARARGVKPPIFNWRSRVPENYDVETITRQIERNA